MALIRTGQGITEISGKTSGVYFHRDKSGLHISKMPRSIKYSRSESQANQKNGFRKCCNFWNSVLTENQLQIWESFSKSHFFNNRFSEKVRLSAYNWFLYYNLVRARWGLALYSVPPEE